MFLNDTFDLATRPTIIEPSDDVHHAAIIGVIFSLIFALIGITLVTSYICNSR